MLLKSLKLVHFRQFINESIDFAQGENGRNVTIIIGENGTGKTTFAQAFFWCLYGTTSFADKSMLNKKVERELKPNQESKVLVELKLRHGEAEYTLTREQTYRRERTGKLKAENAVFNIAMKDGTGKTEYIRSTRVENEVEAILPQELSKYFFFDGERIENMSRDIAGNKKSVDFAEAVKGLLGLNGMASAIKHLNPKSRSSVIGSYESSYSADSDGKIKRYTEEINQCKTKIGEIDARLREIDNQIAEADKRRVEKTVEIKQYEDGAKLQKQKEDLEKKDQRVRRMRFQGVKDIYDVFSKGVPSFVALPMIDGAMKMLRNTSIADKDIPNLHAKTIEYLLKRKNCICGAPLENDNDAVKHLMDLLTLLPPQSISATIGQFKKDAKSRVKSYDDLYEVIQNRLEIISQQDEELADLADEIMSVERKLGGKNVHDRVRAINGEIQQCQRMIDTLKNERDRKLLKKHDCEQKKERCQTERSHLTSLDEENRKIERYKAYAQRIYNELQVTYDTSERNIRERLQATINELFKQIYEGGLYLTIDERYHITVAVDDYMGDVETSTAQSISVIFAFITSIIKMARENKNATDENAQLLSSEPYPLVMDAPLSAFDKRRIKTVCEALPETAEQVIIFIKDTDGELAEHYMGQRIGSRHSFRKVDEFETVLQ